MEFQPPEVSLYLKAKERLKTSPLYDAVTAAIAEHAGTEAAKMIVAAAAFEAADTRNPVDRQN